MAIARLTIVGVGLIGGSFAAAMRSNGFAERIVGIEPDPAAAQAALDAGLVDAIDTTVADDAQLVLVATPSDKVADIVVQLRGHAGVLMDVGSVKAPIVSALTDALGAMPPNYVPAHPIAGSAESGPQAARPDLFEGATVVLTPSADTDAAAVELAAAAWQAAGADTQQMDAGEHDSMLAMTSHLPHALAFTFMQQVGAADLRYTGGGFRDFTRIAAADDALWWRIFAMNRSALLDAAEEFAGNLDTFIGLLRRGDEAAGRELLRRAAELRRRLDES